MRVRRQGAALLLAASVTGCAQGSTGQPDTGTRPESTQVAVTAAGASTPTTTEPTEPPKATATPSPAANRTAAATAGRPTPGSSTPAPLDVAEADGGTRVHVRVGQQLRLTLPPEFVQVTISDRARVRLASVSGGFPTGSQQKAVLVALAPGEATVASSTDAVCLHTTPPCAQPQRSWTLAVSIDR